ncbi:thioredoxin peroxidase [Martiniozyma asiatica (nom. inval.)]|nr:thioredoxin peroxidase [Martiniozyma asiatica]
MTTQIQTTDLIPSGTFYYLPPSDGTVCINTPTEIDPASQIETPALIINVPAAFSPTCSERHIPSFLTSTAIAFLKERGIKEILVLSTDSPFTTRAWGEHLAANADDSVKESLVNGYIKFVSESGADWSKKIGLAKAANDKFTKDGFRGIRSAIVVGTSNKVEYIGVDAARGVVEFSGIDGVLNGWKGSLSKF